MLAEDKLKILQDLISNLTNEELAWMNGYLNGIVSTQEPKEIKPVCKKRHQ